VTSDSISTLPELYERIRTAYDELSETIRRLPDELLLEPNTIGSWSVRDVIAHIGGDELWMAGQLEALRAERIPTAASCYGIDTPLPPDMDWSQDGRNAWQHERLKGLSLEDTRSMAVEAHRRLLAAIATFTDQELSERLAIAQLGTVGHIRPPEEGEAAWPLWEWVRGVTYHHFADHVKDIRAVRGR
jgi:uncharacterized damage-inducible protein DinB